MAKAKTLVRRVRNAWKDDPEGDKANDLLCAILRGELLQAWDVEVNELYTQTRSKVKQRPVDLKYARVYDKAKKGKAHGKAKG